MAHHFTDSKTHTCNYMAAVELGEGLEPKVMLFSKDLILLSQLKP